MSLLIILIGFTVIALIDVPSIIKSKKWRELVVYSAVFILAFSLGIAFSFDIKLPSMVKVLQSFYRDVLHLSFTPP